MAIGSVIQKGSMVFVYDEKGRVLCTIPAGNIDKGDGLTGYTSGTLSIRKGNMVMTYDEKGRLVSSSPAR